MVITGFSVPVRSWRRPLAWSRIRRLSLVGGKRTEAESGEAESGRRKAGQVRY